MSPEIYFSLMFVFVSGVIFSLYKLEFFERSTMIVAVAVCAPLAMQGYKIERLTTLASALASNQKAAAELSLELATNLGQQADCVDKVVDRIVKVETAAAKMETAVAKLKSDMQDQSLSISNASSRIWKIELGRDIERTLLETGVFRQKETAVAKPAVVAPAKPTGRWEQLWAGIAKVSEMEPKSVKVGDRPISLIDPFIQSISKSMGVPQREPKQSKIKMPDESFIPPFYYGR